MLSSEIIRIIETGIRSGKYSAQIAGEIITSLAIAGVQVTKGLLFRTEVELDIERDTERGGYDIAIAILYFLNLEGYLSEDPFLQDLFIGAEMEA